MFPAPGCSLLGTRNVRNSIVESAVVGRNVTVQGRTLTSFLTTYFLVASGTGRHKVQIFLSLADQALPHHTDRQVQTRLYDVEEICDARYDD